MSGGGGGGDTTTTTQQTFSPVETAARSRIFSEAEKAFTAQQSAVTGGGTPAEAATYAPIVPGRFVGGGGNYNPRGGQVNQGVWQPQSGGELLTPYQAAIPGAQANTPAGNANPAAAPVPFSPETLQSQEQVSGFAQGGAQQGADVLQEALRYGLTDARDPNNNPALQDLLDATRRRMTNSFLEDGGLLQQVRQNSVNAGQVGGSRQEIGEGIATGKATEAIADAQTQIINNAYNTGQETFGRTLAFGPQTLQSGALPGTLLGAVGAQNENLAQLQEDFAASGRQFDLNAPFIPVQNYANIVNGTSAPGTIVTGSQPRNSGGIGGILSGGLGGGLTGASLAAGTAFGGPAGAAVGAGVGILASLF